MRVDWLGDITPWLSLGAAYASRVYTREFEQYDGLLANGGLEIPENFPLGWRSNQHYSWFLPLTISASILAAYAPMPMVY